MVYTPTGPFSNGLAPGLSSTFFNNIEAWIAIVDNSPGTVLNGSTAGTATLYQPFQGVFKLVIVKEIGFRNGGGSTQTLAIPTPFTATVLCFTGGTGPFQLLGGGSARTMQQITGLNAGADNSVSSQTTIRQNWWCHEASLSVDTISFTSGDSSTHNGQIVLLGI